MRIAVVASRYNGLVTQGLVDGALAELARRQQPDGSWVNANAQWLEGDPNLVTGYALLTLTYCRPKP